VANVTGAGARSAGWAQACVNCGVGSYTAAGSTRCRPCPAGRADTDYNEQTPCLRCAEGANTYAPAGGTECHRCPPGTADHDRDPATPCRRM
jgi:hypothetical protein